MEDTLAAWQLYRDEVALTCGIARIGRLWRTDPCLLSNLRIIDRLVDDVEVQAAA